jgi:hypothetical protein
MLRKRMLGHSMVLVSYGIAHRACSCGIGVRYHQTAMVPRERYYASWILMIGWWPQYGRQRGLILRLDIGGR